MKRVRNSTAYHRFQLGFGEFAGLALVHAITIHDVLPSGFASIRR
jgi:hypothetical protein